HLLLRHAGPHALHADEEFGRRPLPPLLIQFHHPLDHRVHHRKPHDHVRIHVGRRDLQAQRRRRPIQQRDVLLPHPRQRGRWVVLNRLGDARIAHLQPAHAIEVCTRIEPPPARIDSLPSRSSFCASSERCSTNARPYCVSPLAAPSSSPLCCGDSASRLSTASG